MTDPLSSLLAKLELWLSQGRVQQASDLESQLIARAGDDVRLWCGLAGAHQRTGGWAAAVIAQRRAAALAPDDFDIRLGLAEALAGSARWPEALREADAVTVSGSHSFETLLRLTQLRLSVGQPQEALQHAMQAVALEPHSARALLLLAASERQTGLIMPASDHIDQVLALEPDNGEAVWLRSDLRRASAMRNNVDRLQERTMSPMTPGLDTRVHYALGKELEDLGEFDQAFANFARGAALQRSRSMYDLEREIDLLKTSRCPHDHLPNQTLDSATNAIPIFVLGLPRTGTSLIEAILAAHSKVIGRGELPAFDRALYDIALAHGATDEPSIRSMGLSLPPPSLRNGYLEQVGETKSGFCFIDKRPRNVLNIALIRTCLPEAKIILVGRDLRDTGMAMFKTLFNAGAYPFSYDLDELGRYLNAYRDLASHWTSHFDEDILHVQYESLVADVEGETRRMLAYCGLDFDPACINFHESREPATSASAVQVRRPAYQTSVGSWRRYEAQLAPFLARLNDGRD